MTDVRVSGVADFAELGVRWRDLEQRGNGSFFQSWTWVGCLARERFPDPVLVEATDAGRTVALGLFNRVRRRLGGAVLYLNESGNPDLDCPYVEQNGILAEAGREDALTTLCLGPLCGVQDVVLSGVDDTTVACVHRLAGRVLVRRQQGAPFVDLAAVRQSGGDYLSGRSANTRQQLRRSDRFYAGAGGIAVEAADSVAAAHATLDAMAALHQASWEARGHPGSFAKPFFRRFHQALIEEALPRGEVWLAHVSNPDGIIGILYNFLWRRRVLAYQSGFVYRDDKTPAKPGLTCHHAAIRAMIAQDFDVYDFLSGEDRYKRSLSDRLQSQSWIEAGPRWSPRLLLRDVAGVLRS